MDMLRQLLEMDNEQFDAQTVFAKLKSAEKSNDMPETIGFGLEEIDKETGEKRIVKVFIAKEQANEFEAALAAALDEFEGSKEIAEILFDLREKFNIVNIEWPEIPEDEEIEQSIGDKEPSPDTVLTPDKMDDEINTDEQTIDSEAEAQSTLQSIIAMMQTNAEAEKAKYDAEAEKAKAVSAKYAAQAAMAKVKAQEEILDMEAHNKAKEEKKKESEQLAKLAKYRHEKEIDTAVENEEISKKINSNKNEDEYLGAHEYMKYVDQYLMNNKAQN